MSKLVVTDAQAKVLARFRAPSARRAYLLFGFAREGYTNHGYTLRLDAGEPAVACAPGVVRSVTRKPATWQHSSGDLDSFFPYEVVIDHGQNVISTTAGIRSTQLQAGVDIGRGDLLGALVTNECFFAVRVSGVTVNPVDISRHFVPMQEQQVPGQGHKLRFGPDTILRSLADGIVALVYSGLRYFSRSSPLLLNVDFNGGGLKTGLAAVGLSASDYWLVYNAGPFAATSSSGYYYYYLCANGTAFSKNPQVFLYDSDQNKTGVRLERVASAAGTAGSSSQFDAMLSTWIGANGGTPEENFFAIKGLPAGSYDLYLYANEGALPFTSTFYVAVDNGAPVAKTTAPTVAPAFVEDANYVKFAVTVGSSSSVSVKAYGYFAGLQLMRT